MPFKNHFQHQTLTDGKPTAPWETLAAAVPPPPDSEAFSQSVHEFTDAVSPQVDAIWLVHGTFVGNDALGIFGQIERAVPAIGTALKQFGKQLTDTITGDTGNFNQRFVDQLRDQCPVHQFIWSGENTHSGRCKAAVELLARMVEQINSCTRVMLWGHSHAGNVAALITNLLGGEPWIRESFLEMVQPLFSVTPNRRNDVQIVRDAFAAGVLPGELKLDIVNFGTPISYGWDTGGYRRLLHVVSHRCRPQQPDWLSPPLNSAGRWLSTVGGAPSEAGIAGDAIQVLGIAGSEFLPWLLNEKTRKCETTLQAFVAPGNTRQEYLDHARLGMRVANEGTTLLVDYDPSVGQANAAMGHAIYTQIEWLGFHCDLVNRVFYR